MTKKIFKIVLFFSFLIIASCKKSDKEFEKLKLFEQSQLDTHNQQVNSWMRMFQVNEQIKTNTLKLSKTVYSKGQFITSFQVGEQGTAIYFISENNKFNTYGIKSELKGGNNSGLVEIFDFQKMAKRGLKFNTGKLTSILTYPMEQHFNNNNQSNSSSQTNGNQLGRTNNIIGGLRKFFCELFGGVWLASVAENATNPGGSCFTSSNGEGQVESILNSDGGGGGFNWGPIFTNINNPSFFDNTNSSFWQNYLNNPNTGGGGSGTGTTSIPALTLEQKRDFLITTLNLNQTQEFYLVNTDGAISRIFDYLLTSNAVDKIDISLNALNQIAIGLVNSYEFDPGWYNDFTNNMPTPQVSWTYLGDNGQTFIDLIPTDEPDFTFDPADNVTTNYPKFYNLVKNLKKFVKDDTTVMNSLITYSGFTKQQIIDKLTIWQGPKIVIKPLHGLVFGKFNKKEGTNQVTINKTYIEKLENNIQVGSSKQALAFLLISTLLHELVHLGTNANGINEGIYDFGYGFERDAFGVIVDIGNAGEIAIRFKKYL